ncbi:MAG: hypothetical protein HOV71_04840 [Hamadaea sp.]|nr:hypothetical protein [Hamadaea sp.]NUR47443.1 hypothetical protein [Hamadaea sp.]NUT03422.1 hypothetical protein [Hamadaea sp.]
MSQTSGEGRKPSRIPPIVKFHAKVDDDLLTGFRHPSGRPGELRGFFATTIGISLIVWDLAFSLGAYHTVFYYRLLQIFVVCAVLLLGALVLRRHLTVRWWMLTIFAIPVIWLVWRLIAPIGGRWRFVYDLIDLGLIGMVLLTLPVTLWVVARILAPEYFALSTLRLRLASAAIVLVVAIAGLLTGQFNDHVVDCHDFIVAGDDTPANCLNAPPRSK